MYINNTLFTVDLETILTDLQAILRNNGSSLLGTIKRTQTDIMVSCPYHKGGMEKKPSMGISKSDAKCHCFSCNCVVSLPELITYCLGEEDKSKTGAPGWRWLLRNYSTVTIDSRKDIQLDFGRDKSRKPEIQKYVSEEELDKYRYYHPYWAKRGITDENIIELFDLGYDKDTGCITLPVRDIKGNCLFVARRSVQTKYFNYPQGVEKPLYGLYELYHCNDELKTFNGLPAKCNEIIICESMIDAITAWQHGKYCLALNGLGTALQFKQLRELPCRKLILATDADEAGMKARERIKKNVTNKIITEYVWNRDEAKDLNDMSKDMFLTLKEVYT